MAAFNLLFVECPSTRLLLLEICQRIPLLQLVSTELEAEQLFGNTPVDLFIFDTGKFQPSTMSFIEKMHHHHDNVSVIVFANETISVEQELKYLEQGVYDVVRVPFVQPILEAKISKVLLLRKELCRLMILSSNDTLTAIANRAYFDQTIEAECDRAVRHHDTISLIMVDIDHFKKYNDTYGHVAGDAAIKAVAAVLKSSARRPGDLVARYGGEEFAILLPRTNSIGVKVVSMNIALGIEALAIDHRTSDARNVLTVSQGAVTVKYAKDLMFTKELTISLLKDADAALYAAKRQGRNQLVQTEKFYSKNQHDNGC